MKPFTFYDIYYTPLQALSDELAGKFFRKICNCLEGKQTETDGKDTPEFELYWESIADDLESYRNSTGKSCGLDKRYRRALSRQFVVMDKVTFLQLNISKKQLLLSGKYGRIQTNSSARSADDRPTEGGK